MLSSRAIAAAQTVPIRGDVNANLAEHVRLAALAAAEKARVVVFPELSLTGYELALAESLAFSEDDARLAPLSDAAAAHSVTLVVGAPVRLDGRLHIAAFVLSPDGTTELYTKHHLGAFSASDGPDGVVPPPEDTVFVPGDRDPLIVFGGNTAAIAICADVWRRSHPRAAAERGAGTYLAGTFTIRSHLEMTVENLRACAERHSMAVVFANYGGPTGGLAPGGSSAIWSEKGHLLAKLDTAGAGVVVAAETPDGWRATALPWTA